MDLKEQKYVCMLAECGNLTRAAEKLFISQPALSIYITNLEKNMGVRLFDRSGKRFVLTYAGERYVEKAKQMLQLEWEFNEELLVLAREETGRIRLG
ncbi:MAG: LysR family transcriptional regulator, partial [Lachnospiraceae bacterium]|nr:LysR family transcriptional regulator [Lachnospiraceae bacterium]